MNVETELLIKRIILGVLGLLGLVPMILMGAGVARHPDGPRLFLLGVLVVGALVGPLLLTRWERWGMLKPGNRIWLFLLSSYLVPPAILALKGFEHIEGLVFLSAPFALGLTALWWSLRGHKLDQSRRPARLPNKRA